MEVFWNNAVLKNAKLKNKLTRCSAAVYFFFLQVEMFLLVNVNIHCFFFFFASFITIIILIQKVSKYQSVLLNQNLGMIDSLLHFLIYLTSCKPTLWAGFAASSCRKPKYCKYKSSFKRSGITTLYLLNYTSLKIS